MPQPRVLRFAIGQRLSNCRHSPLSGHRLETNMLQLSRPLSQKTIIMKITTRFLKSSALLLATGVARMPTNAATTVELFKHAGRRRILRPLLCLCGIPHHRSGRSDRRRRARQGSCLCPRPSGRRDAMTLARHRIPARRQSLQPDHFLPGQTRPRCIRIGKFEFSAAAAPSPLPQARRPSVPTAPPPEASSAPSNATTNGNYQTGMAVFTIAKAA